MRDPHAHGIPVKKQYGQHFLRDTSVVDRMLEAVTITPQTNIFEIGCGDGFLTELLLKTPCARLWVFEIDHAWAIYVRDKLRGDDRMTIFEEDILQVDFARFGSDRWTLLANLPYQITFPILYRLIDYRHLLDEGVVMIQEEVAQKLVKAGGRGYGFTSLYFQYYFEMRLLVKVPPGAFYPPPAIHSRLIYFKPRATLRAIPDEERFWKFIKMCFAQPRRTLKNNLMATHYGPLIASLPLTDTIRAQELTIDDFIQLWNDIRALPA